jgi:molecular chaperone HtpG
MFRNNREDFEGKWEHIGPFIKYGMLTDEKFEERARKFSLLQSINKQNSDKQHFTLAEYREKIAPSQTDKNETVVHIYSNQPKEHDAYIAAATAKGLDILVTDNIIDAHWLQLLEQKLDKVQFKRVDADTVDKLVEREDALESILSETEQETIKTIFNGKVGTGATVELRALTATDAPVQITRPEWMRRMKEMQMMQGMGAGMADFDMYNVVINTNHPLVTEKILKSESEEQGNIAAYLYDLARLQQNLLKGADLTAFINKSVGFL